MPIFIQSIHFLGPNSMELLVSINPTVKKTMRLNLLPPLHNRFDGLYRFVDPWNFFLVGPYQCDSAERVFQQFLSLLF